MEHYFYHGLQSGSITWGPGITGEYSLVHSLDDVLGIMDLALNNKTYIDAHAWCFVPHSFRLMIHDLFCLGFIPLKEVEFFPTESFEFYVTLGRNGEGINKSRLEMLNIIESEIKDKAFESKQPSKIPITQKIKTWFNALSFR